MKAQERHHLKQNEFVTTVRTVTGFVAENRTLLVRGSGLVLVLLLIGGGYYVWNKHRNDQAGAMLGVATATRQAPLASTLPSKDAPAGLSFPDEKARDEATVAAYGKVIETYPSTQSALAARYYSGLVLRDLGRFTEAEASLQQAIDKGGTSLYGSMARIGLAETLVSEKQYDKAIAIYTDLSGQRDGMLPVDGVLIQLARACAKAGKAGDAKAAYKRVVDEFADSPYVATAKTEMEKLN